MKCPKCQSDNRKGARFCLKCGEKLEVKCPQCDKVLPIEALFCDECGHDLKESQKTSLIDYDEPKSYTPKFLAEKILTTRSAIEGERKLVTVFFADVANYTGLSEKLDPEEVHQIMNGAFEIMINEIHKYEGTINQFTGDGVMALFGAPIAHEDHAQRACHAALVIQKQINPYGERIKNDCGVEFRMRVGLNSGLVIVGSIGDDLRMDYTAVGDTTNLSARMESLAKPGSVLISKNTYKMVKDYFEFNPLGEIKVKGKEELQEAFELIKTSEIETRIHAAAAKGLTKFVGRKNSLPALMAPLEKVEKGSGQVAGVVGEAGVGKSRILLELHNRLPVEKFTWLEGRCLHYGGSMAYLPILDVLRSYFEIIDGDREYIVKKKISDKINSLDETLNSVIAPFQDLLSVTVDDEAFTTLEPQQKREKTFEALRDLFIRESQNNPLILVIEDMHWIDNTTQELVNYLIDWLANTHIFLILAYRPEYTHQWGSRSFYTKIGLNQLGMASSAELVQAILQEAEMVPELRELILNRAAGNPLFMEEFTHTLLENGSIQKENDKYILSEGTKSLQVPDTIQGIIAARMDRLEDNLKSTMQVASVIGRDFAFQILQTITGMREDLKSSLLNLQGLEFIYEKALFPELEYIFKHAMIQEVAYGSLLQTKRKELHENIGKAIEEIYADRLEEFYEMLAYHYSKSDNHEKAYQYLKLSGEKAFGNYANLESYNFYKQAIDRLKQLPDTEENKRAQIEVLLLLYSPMYLLDFPEGTLDFLHEGENLSIELGDERSLAKFYSQFGVYYNYKGDPLSGRKYSENGFAEARKIQDIDLMAPLAFSLCEIYNAMGEYHKIADIAPEVIDLLEKSAREEEYFGQIINVYAMVCGFCGLASAFLGDFDQGEIYCRKGLNLAIKINDLVSIGVDEMMLCCVYAVKGDGKLCVRHCQESIKHFEEINSLTLVGFTLSLLGYGFWLLGDLKSALKHIERGLDIQDNLPDLFRLCDHYYYLNLIYYDLGDFLQAKEYAEKAIEFSQKAGIKTYEAYSKMYLGRTLFKIDPSQQNKSKELILEGIKIGEAQMIKTIPLHGYYCLGEMYATAGRKEKAFKNLKKAETAFQRMGMGFWVAKAQAVLDRL